ncbi:MAG: hypothetical protein VX944_15350 [Myxococcota bacterium]|nr:hypothetical protein [Myxococcota bacterium]
MALSTKQLWLVAVCGLAASGCEVVDDGPPASDEAATGDEADSSGAPAVEGEPETDEGEDGEPAPDTGGATATDTGIASAIYEDLSFPTEADSWSESYYGAASEGFLWRLVHGVAGERETEFDAITAVGIAVELDENTLTCESQDFNVVVEGETLGTVEARPGDDCLTASFALDSPITIDGALDVEYRVARSGVEHRCGLVSFGVGGNTLRLTHSGDADGLPDLRCEVADDADTPVEDTPDEVSLVGAVDIYTTRAMPDGSTEVVCDASVPFRSVSLATDDGSFFPSASRYVGSCDGCDYQLYLKGPSRSDLYEACGPGVFDGWADLADLEPWADADILAARAQHRVVAELAFADSFDPARHRWAWSAGRYGLPASGTTIYAWLYPYPFEAGIGSADWGIAEVEELRTSHFLAYYAAAGGVGEARVVKQSFRSQRGVDWRIVSEYCCEFGYYTGHVPGSLDPEDDFLPTDFESDHRSIAWSGSYTHEADPGLTTQVRAHVDFGDECLADDPIHYYDGPATEPGEVCSTSIDPYIGADGVIGGYAEVVDCSGCCVRESTQEAYRGDGICDDASTSHINLNCAAFDFDGGDCGGAAESDALCDDTCVFPADGECDDGGVGSMWSFCDLGTDCTDCGPR